MLNESAEPVDAGPARGQWKLREDVRRRVFGSFQSSDDIRAAIDASSSSETTGDPTRNALRELLNTTGRPKLEGRSLEALLGMDQAVEWLSAAGVSALPSQPEIRALIQRERLLEPMRRLVVGFEGRDEDLRVLRQYVDTVPDESSVLQSVAKQFTRLGDHFRDRPPLFIFGPGGGGKSTLIAQSILEHIDRVGTLQPFVLLDFDRSVLDPRHPDSLLEEIIAQLRVQFPEHEEKLKVLDELLTQRALAEDQVNAEQSSHYGRSERLRGDLTDIMNAVTKKAKTNLLLIVDTFEIVQRRGPTAVYTVLDLIGNIMSRVPRLRVVLVGRAELRHKDFPFTKDQIKWTPHSLKGFDPKAGRAYLRARMSKQQRSMLSDADLDRLVLKVRGNPLCLRLAARVLAREGLSDVERAIDRQQLDEAIAEEQLQGMLHKRIVEHLDNDELKKLANPGLIVRRITTDVIRDVLADPCRIDLSVTGEAELLELLQLEGSLVELVDDRTVKHRSDVRLIMLPQLRKELRGIAEQIDDAAVRYWKNRSEPAERAEEIYHRLWRNDSEEELNAAWLPEAGGFLEDALDEFQTVSPGDWARIWLSDKLDRDLPDELRLRSGQVVWERDTQLRAQPLLADGKPDETLRLLRERPHAQWTYDCPLWKLEIQALLLTGNAKAALGVVDEALERANQGNNARHKLQLLSIRVNCFERLKRLPDADTASALALQYARGTGDSVAVFTCGLVHYRIAGRRNRSKEPSLVSLRGELVELSSLPAVQRELRNSPSSLREAIGVLGADAPELIVEALERYGIEPVRSNKALLKLYSNVERWVAQETKTARSDRGKSESLWLAGMIRSGAIAHGTLDKIADIYSKLSEQLGTQVLRK
jgi:hypothetical protein